MDYRVCFVDDDRLGLDWVLIEEPCGGFLFIVRRSAVSPLVLVEAWAAYAKAVNTRTALVAV